MCVFFKTVLVTVWVYHVHYCFKKLILLEGKKRLAYLIHGRYNPGGVKSRVGLYFWLWSSG